MEAIAEDLTLVRSTCLTEDEFSWGGVDDELDAKWEVSTSSGLESYLNDGRYEILIDLICRPLWRIKICLICRERRQGCPSG